MTSSADKCYWQRAAAVLAADARSAVAAFERGDRLLLWDRVAVRYQIRAAEAAARGRGQEVRRGR